ncbi:uncharacterized protein LOC134539355 [Bacillus rossius redtenbacheri]|uniref:uncharacterized protein LOC134539355 n=1 Tax=Bacillus rossius redtenbacheri TaxID=93214 RepID=UPI002FDC7D5F
MFQNRERTKKRGMETCYKKKRRPLLSETRILTTMKVALISVATVCWLSAAGGAETAPSERNWEDRFDAVIQKAQAEVARIRSWVDEQGQKLQDKAKEEISKAYQSVEQATASAQQQGATLGVNVSSCVDARQGQVDAEVQSLVQASTACVTGELDSAVDLASTLLSQVEAAKNKVVDFQAAFKECGKKNKFQKQKCIAEQTAKALAEVVKVETEVTGFFSKETLLFEELPAKLLACEGKQAAAAESSAKQMASDLQTCLAGLGIHS